MYDIIIIGAGISGTLIARELSRYALRTAVLERCHDIADGATMANSAIVHTGYDPEDGTLKAELNVRGALLYPQLTKDLGCLYRKVGAFVAACGKKEEEHLQILADRAERRGIRYEFLNAEEAHRREPNLSENVTQVLNFPDTAVIYPWEVAIAAMETAVKNGTELHSDCCVQKIEKTETGYLVRTDRGSFETRLVISCAGTHAEEIASMVSDEVPYHIHPRRGEYYVLDKDTDFVHTIVFPVPGLKGKGVLAVPTVYGNVLIGPNSEPCADPDDTGHTQDGLAEVRRNIARTMKNVPFDRVIRHFAGLRPSSDLHDFVIQEYGDAPGFIDVACIESPGLASAPAIAEYVVQNFVLKKIGCRMKKDAVMTHRRPLVMEELTQQEKNEVIRRDPSYGRIVCRCEQISEGEIRAAVRRGCGADTVKGIKKRVRPGMGRCQGGFCEPKVVEIIAGECGISPLEVRLDSGRSCILKGENR